MFSSNPLKPLSKSISAEFSVGRDTTVSVQETFEVQKCVDWIKHNNYSKVCLQFPDSLLSDSLEVALLIEAQLSNKTYILGDTSYGSCCVDEIAAQHIDADAVIHFGHACLSKTTRLPVLYVFPHLQLDLNGLQQAVRSSVKGPTLFIYNIGYHHIVDAIRNVLSDLNVIFSDVILDGVAPGSCCESCKINELGHHSEVRYSHGYCLSMHQPEAIFYLGMKSDQLLTNFMLLFKGIDAWVYEGFVVERVRSLPLLKHICFLIEEIKSADVIGIIVATLTVEGYMEAVSRIKTLCKRAGKKVYVLSVGKPNCAKLSNFPEIQLFVSVSCCESAFRNEVELIQPVATLLEVELALNENRNWDNTFSRDFRDLISGGCNYVELLGGLLNSIPEVSLTTGRLSGHQNIISSELAVNFEKSVLTFSSKHGYKKTWNGLDQDFDKTEVSKAIPGRSGTSMAYEGEPGN